MSPRIAAVAAAALALAAVAQGCGVDAPAARADAPDAPAGAVAVSAPAGERSAPFVIVADSRSGTAAATVPAGGSAPLAFRVANGSGAARTFSLRASVPWLSLAGTVTVPARQSVAVEAVARVAPEAPRGLLRGAVLARAEGDAAARLSVSYESSAPVAVRVVDAP